MIAGLHVLKYLLNDFAQGTLLNASSNFSLKAFANFDWAACPISRISVTGYYVVLGDSPIS